MGAKSADSVPWARVETMRREAVGRLVSNAARRCSAHGRTKQNGTHSARLVSSAVRRCSAVDLPSAVRGRADNP